MGGYLGEINSVKVAFCATISSGAYEKAIKKISSRMLVYSQKCPLFVPLAEEGWTSEKVTEDVASIYL